MKEFLMKEQSRILILVHRLMYIISSFASSFLLIYFLKATNWDLKIISLQYIVDYAVLMLGFYIVGMMVRKNNILNIFKLGILSEVIYLAIIMFLSKEIKDYIIILGAIKGVADSMYWVPRHYMVYRMNKSKAAKKFFSVDATIAKLEDIVLPVIMGACIGYTVQGYTIMFAIMIAILLVAFVVSGWLDLGEDEIQPLKIEELHTFLHDRDIPDLKRMYISEFFNGVSTSGVLIQVVTMLIFLVYQSEFGLGVYNSLLALVVATLTFFMGEHLSDDKFEKVLKLSGVLSILAIILLMFKMDYLTLIIYSVVTGITFVTMGVITNANLLKLSRRDDIKKYTIESIIVRETSLDIGRIVGYIMLYNLGNLNNNEESLKILLFFLVICLLVRIVEMIQSLKRSEEHTMHGLKILKLRAKTFKFFIKKRKSWF